MATVGRRSTRRRSRGPYGAWPARSPSATAAWRAWRWWACGAGACRWRRGGRCSRSSRARGAGGRGGHHALPRRRGDRAAVDPKIGRSEIDFDVESHTVVLVDDVLFTGRTTRAAIDGDGLRAPRAIQPRCSSTGATASCRSTRTTWANRWRRRGRAGRRGARRARRPRPCSSAGAENSAGGRRFAYPAARDEHPHRHLLGIEDLTARDIVQYLDTAEVFFDVSRRRVRKPTLRRQDGDQPLLRGQHAHPHQLRARRQAPLGRRGQHLGERVERLQGRVAPRHGEEPRGHAPRRAGDPPRRLRRATSRPATRAAVVNAGDGTHEHPTQALLDAFTIRRARGASRGWWWPSRATSPTRAWRGQRGAAHAGSGPRFASARRAR